MRQKQSLAFKKASSSFPPIELGDVHVWYTRLDLDYRIVQELRSLLSKDELERASTFHFDLDRDRFIVAHGRLRMMLGHYLDHDPSNIKFHYSSIGKPGLHPALLEFNIAHAGNIALYVFSPGRKVGVDVERIHPVPEAKLIISRYFSVRERILFYFTSHVNRDRVFLEWWTRGEAFIKAIGRKFGDHFGAMSKPRIKLDDQYWEIRSLFPHPDYVGAIAMDESPRKIFCWYWPE